MSYAKCIVCGKEFKDTHSGRKGNKYCCREHFKQHKKEVGTWNKGKKWEEIYKPETLAKLKEHVNSKGKENFNYGRNRLDTKIRNLLNNPKYSENKISSINKDISEKGIEKVIQELFNKSDISKITYQRICFEAWGYNCLNCGVSKEDCQLDVHHIDKNRKNNSPLNLIPLCARCHPKLENDIVKCKELLGKT